MCLILTVPQFTKIADKDWQNVIPVFCLTKYIFIDPQKQKNI